MGARNEVRRTANGCQDGGPRQAWGDTRFRRTGLVTPVISGTPPSGNTEAEIIAAPDQPSKYLTSLGGEVLHPSLINFDIAAANNYAASKKRMVEAISPTMEKVFVSMEVSCMYVLTTITNAGWPW